MLWTVSWHDDYELLSQRDRDELAQVLSILFERTFLVRDVWNSREGRLTGNRHYRLVERLRPLIEEYLKVAGWALQFDVQRGVIALYNRFGNNRARLDRFTTYLVYALRLLYEEEMGRASGRREVVLTLSVVLEKLRTFGIVDRKLPVTQLTASLQTLRRLSVVERVEGEEVEPESRWLLYPAIRLLVPDELVHAVFQQLENSGVDAGGDEGEEAGKGADAENRTGMDSWFGASGDGAGIAEETENAEDVEDWGFPRENEEEAL